MFKDLNIPKSFPFPYSPETFTKKEKDILLNFFTNIDKPVFGIYNLPQEVVGAMFSRYSRSDKSVRRLFLDEFWDPSFSTLKSNSKSLQKATDRTNNFYKKVYAEYGDDSVIQVGSIHIAFEFVSQIAVQIIEDQRNEILNLNQELTKLSKTDYLTNVLNRRAFFDALESERKRTLREHWRIHESNTTISESAEPLQKKLTILHKPHGCFFDHYGNYCCIILDIDHFKYINDTYGHLKGDEVLKELGKILNSKEIFRENDTIARYGGEEFVIMLPETNIFHAKIPAERLRKQIKNLDFTSDDGKTFRVTISIGISEFRISDTTNEDIINRADQALYFAKENGRDQVIVYEDIMND